uniref:Uncharacterized protein n=1 Tax=Histophilus somni (strain 129Pt) TaxID=205914 RepID=Q0I5K6_HISS1
MAPSAVNITPSKGNLVRWQIIPKKWAFSSYLYKKPHFILVHVKVRYNLQQFFTLLSKVKWQATEAT